MAGDRREAVADVERVEAEGKAEMRPDLLPLIRMFGRNRKKKEWVKQMGQKINWKRRERRWRYAHIECATLEEIMVQPMIRQLWVNF